MAANGLPTSVAIVIAGALIAGAIYSRPVPPPPTAPRYAIASSEQSVTRLDTITGEVVVCAGASCVKLRTNPDELFVIDPPE